jgi:hypothetical protein
MLVIALVYSLASLSVSSGGQDIKLEAGVRQLADVAEYAMEDAQYKGTELGLLFDTVNLRGEQLFRYHWRELRPEGWRQPVPMVPAYETRRFPPGLELRLTLEDIPVAEITALSEPVEATPQVIFYASGETTPGSLELREQRSGELLWRVEWDLLGRFDVQPRGLPEEEAE